MDKSFSNKHILITGAARGIGYSIAKKFAQHGARLTLIDNHEANLLSTQKELEEVSPFPVLSYPVDVSNKDQVSYAVKSAEAIAPIHVLVNNAGIAFERPFLQISEEEWNDVLKINLTGMFLVSQAVLHFMAPRKSGVIINMSSKNGIDGESGYAHYNASKGGAIMLTKTLALEFAEYGIRVNAVCPGYIETPMSKEIDPPEYTANFVDRYIPLNRPGYADEIANIFLFLAGEGSSFITGQIIIADGGQLAGQKPFKR